MNPILQQFETVLRKEREMDDDTREGYADGIGNNYQQGRTKAYRSAWGEGRNDRAMLRHVETWRARNGALATTAQSG